MAQYLIPPEELAKQAFPSHPPVGRCPSCGWNAETEYNPNRAVQNSSRVS